MLLVTYVLNLMMYVDHKSTDHKSTVVSKKEDLRRRKGSWFGMAAVSLGAARSSIK